MVAQFYVQGRSSVSIDGEDLLNLESGLLFSWFDVSYWLLPVYQFFLVCVTEIVFPTLISVTCTLTKTPSDENQYFDLMCCFMHYNSQKNDRQSLLDRKPKEPIMMTCGGGA